MARNVIDGNSMDMRMDLRIMSVFDIYNMIKFGDLDINPVYARNFRWSEDQQRQLILSILEGFPISNIIIHEYNAGRFRVVDGVQRLNTIVNFLENKSHLLDENNEKVLFSELSRIEQRRIQDYQVVAYVIREKDIRVLSKIYKKINVSSSEMTAQEKRNFLFYDKGIELVKEFAKMPEFNKLIQGKNVRISKMQDEELVLRFLAFYYNGYQAYNGKMNEFLDDTLRMYTKDASREECARNVFREVCDTVYEIWGEDAFVVSGSNSKRKRLNVALFDIVMYSCAVFSKKSLLANAVKLKKRLENLLENDVAFRRGILGSANTSRVSVSARFEIWLNEVEHICGPRVWRSND